MPTAFKQVADNATSTTTTNLLTTGVTSISAIGGSGVKFPIPGNGYYLTLWNGRAPGSDTNMEKVLVTALTSDTFTCSATTKSHTSPCNIGLLNGSSNILDLQSAVNINESNITGLTTRVTNIEANGTGGGGGGGTGGTGGADPVLVIPTSGTAQTLTLPTAGLKTFDLTLTANCTLSFAGATSGIACVITVIVRQNATGGYTLTYPTTVKWAGGAPRFLSTAANSVDIVAFMSVDGGTSWIGY